MQPLGLQFVGQYIDPGEIAAGAGEAGDETEPRRVFRRRIARFRLRMMAPTDYELWHYHHSSHGGLPSGGQTKRFSRLAFLTSAGPLASLIFCFARPRAQKASACSGLMLMALL
jgi:hypothetical protein